MKKITLLAALLIIFSTQSFAGGNGGKPKQKSQTLVIDVRSPFEYRTGHYNGAINIPVNQIQRRYKELGNKNTTIIVYCRTGVRSENAKNKLKQLGFKKVYNGGGLADMMSDNYLMGK